MGARNPPCYLRRGRAVVSFASPEKVRGSGAPKGARVTSRMCANTRGGVPCDRDTTPSGAPLRLLLRRLAPHQLRAALLEPAFARANPASSSQSGHSAARAGSRSRPGTSLRGSRAGSRTSGGFLPSHRISAPYLQRRPPVCSTSRTPHESVPSRAGRRNNGTGMRRIYDYEPIMGLLYRTHRNALTSGWRPTFAK
jgi:hypothetical protein